MGWKAFLVQILAVFILTVAPARAQSDAVIRGQLVAEADGAALAQGTVTLKSMATGASTQATVDPAGHFTFPNVSPGEFVLTGPPLYRTLPRVSERHVNCNPN